MSLVEVVAGGEVPAPQLPSRSRTGVDVIALCDDYWRLAQRIAATEFVPTALRRRPEAVLAALLSGAERGLGPMESLRSVNIIEGKPSLSAEAKRALVLAAGHSIEIVETSATRCSAIGRRAGSEQTSPAFVWTIQRAQRAGLTNKDNWKKYPEAMLLARATSDLCTAIFPDIMAGLATTEEVIDELAAPPETATTRRRTATTRPTVAPATAIAATATVTPPDAPAPPSEPTATDPTPPNGTSDAGAADGGATAAPALDEIPGSDQPSWAPDPRGPTPPDPGLARRIHAELAQALPDVATADRDRIRHALVAMATRRNPDGPITSSADLTLEEQIDLSKIIGEIRAARAQIAIGPDAIELRSHGWRYDITLDPPTVRTTRSQGDETTGDDEQLDLEEI